MNDAAGEPGILTQLEAANRYPKDCGLTLSEEFIDHIRAKYFSTASKNDPAFRDDLWNMLEGANALHKRIKDNGIPAPDIAGAQQALRAIKTVLESASVLSSADFEKFGLALIALLQNVSNDAPLKFLDRERILATILDGKRVRLYLRDTLILIDGCLQFTPPDTLPERRSWALRAWCLCVVTFWVDRARLKPTLTKLNEPGGVRIKSKLGKFCEDCLGEIGVDAVYELRSALTFAKTQSAKEAQLKKLLLDGRLEAATDLLARWKDRLPIAIT